MQSHTSAWKSFALVLGGSLLLCLPLISRAAEDEVTAETPEQEKFITITIRINKESGILPSSILYRLDSLFERVGLWIARTDTAKLDTLLQFTKEKSSEVAVEKKDGDAAAQQKAQDRYAQYLSTATALVKASQQQEVLGQFITTLRQQEVPEPMKEAVSTAIDQALEQLVTKAKEEGTQQLSELSEELQQEVKDRIAKPTKKNK